MTDNREHLIEFDAYVKELEADSDPSHEADVLLLTCMDFRFLLEISQLMRGIKYDHVILAGAALGAVAPAKPDWNQTFLDHLGLAVELHTVKRVLVMEHRECGAYGPAPGFGLLPRDPDRNEETRVHKEQVAILAERIPKTMMLGFDSLLLEVPRPGGPWMCEKLK